MTILRSTLRLLGLVVVLVAVTMGGLLAALNTSAGQRQIARLTASATDGRVQLSGISGAFPAALRIGRIAIADPAGVWLELDNAALDWSPWRLFGGTALIHDLSADKVAVLRLPGGPASQSSGGSFVLPISIRLERLHVDRLELGSAVAGAGAVLSVDGNMAVRSLTDGNADLTVTRLDADGRYHLTGQIGPERVQAHIALTEPAHGLLANLEQLPDLGALDIAANIDGPWNAAVAHLEMSAGPMRASAHGTLDLPGEGGTLDVMAQAPAMTPSPQLSWQRIAFDAHIAGKFAAPQADVMLELDGVSASGAGLNRLTMALHGDTKVAHLHAAIDGLRIPGPLPKLFAASPITLDAEAALDAKLRPVRFALHHDLLDLSGTAQTAGPLQLAAKLSLPDLAPLAQAGGADLRGHSLLDLAATMSGDTTHLSVDGPLAIIGGAAPLPGLIGADGKIGVSAVMAGDDIALARLTLDGSALHLAAAGGLTAGVADLDWTLKLADLRVLATTLEGNLAVSGKLHGPTDGFAATADISGEIASPGVPGSPLTAHLEATGLPGQPQGKVDAHGSLDGAPLELVANVERDADGKLAAQISRGGWKSAHLAGDFTLAPGASIPVGTLSVQMANLDELRRLTGLALTGSINGTAQISAEGGHTIATAKLLAKNAGLTGTATLRQVSLDARIVDPDSIPQIDAKLQLDGIAAQGIGGSLVLTGKGGQDALVLGLLANLTGIGDGPLALRSSAKLDAVRRNAALSAFTADYQGETLKLLGPARVDFADGVAVDQLRLGLRDAVLAVSGRVSPALDLTARLSNVTADLARIALPDLQAAGMLQANAKLGGTLARPVGRVQVTADGMRATSGAASSFPAADLLATADLAGTSAQLNAKLTAGENRISLTGTASLDAAGPMKLQAKGLFDLATLDRILAAGGRRLHGRAVLDVAIDGTPQTPRPTGSLRLSDGEVQDFNTGLRISAIDALIEAQGDTIQISHFTGHAGPGTVSATGQISLTAPEPIDIGLTMDKARLLTSDQLTADLTSDLHLRGDLGGQLALGGAIRIDSGEIRLPEGLPADVAVLNVRVRGAPPPPAPTPGPDIGLALKLDAPGRIFVRGRGLDAELSGNLRIDGTAAAPQPVGKFEMRRGTFNLAGQTLTFTTGEVGFDGSAKSTRR